MKITARSLHLAGGIAALLLASTFTGFGITNSIPQFWDFEDMTNGQDIVDISTDSWYGEAGAFVATNGTYDTPQNGYPIDTNHTVFASLTAPVTNYVEGGAGATVWIDHMVKPERWKEDGPPPDLPADTQMAYFVNTNGHLVVYHCQLATSGARESNIWSEVDSVTIESNDWARISIGMIDPQTMKLIDGDIAAQTRQVFSNLSAVLTAAGVSLQEVVKTTVFLQDMGDFPEMNAVYKECFGSHKPARATIEVAKLPLGAGVEIEATAVRS